MQFGFCVAAESGKLFHVKTIVIYLDDSQIKLMSKIKIEIFMTKNKYNNDIYKKMCD